MSDGDPTATALLRTPLYDLHVAKGGRMVPFAGYAMPVQFPAGIMAEHLHTRSEAGLFDVSHMGQILLRPRSGRVEDAALALERSEEHTSELQSLMRNPYAVFCLEKKT